MGCCDETNIDGLTGNNVTLNTSTINQSAINGGTMTGTTYAKDCDGNDVQAGDPIATCANLQAAISAIPQGVDLTGAAWTPDHRLSLTFSDGSIITTNPLPQAQMVSGASNDGIPVSTECSVPTTIYGGRNALLGEPVMWVELDGGYIIPVFRKIECGGTGDN